MSIFIATEILDKILRYVLMSFCLFFFIYLLLIYNKAKKAKMELKAKFQLTFSIFFLTFFINYLQTEIILIEKIINYPDIIPDNFVVLNLFHPADGDLFLLVIFLSGVIPLIYVLEKYMIKKKLIITTLGLIGFIFCIVGVFYSNEIVLNLIIPYEYVILILISLFVIIFYLQIAIKSKAELRLTGLLISIGFLLQLIGLFITSNSNIFGHILDISGMILIFIGVLKIK